MIAKLPRLGVVLPLAALLAAGVVVWRSLDWSDHASAAGPARSAEIPVTAGVAETRTVPVLLRGLGTVQAHYMVTIRTRVDGQIMQVFYNEGQEVKAGDRLLQIDPRPFQAALDQAKATQQKDEAQLAGAEVDLKRYAALVAPGYQTKQAYDDQKALVAQLQATVKADQAVVEADQLNLVYADVRSPIDGRTGARLVDPGNFVQASQGTALVTIAQIKPIYVSFPVPQDQLDTIRRNQAQKPLAVLAYGSDDQTLLSKGELTLINNQVDPATGTVQLKGTFANLDERLWPGEFVNARLVLAERENAVTVTAQTVMHGPSGDYVYAIKADNTVERRPVQVALIEGGLAVIAKGLDAGEKVVVEGQYRLTDGARVKIRAGEPGTAGAAPQAG
jgi:membrane fusion protein, multidrug efflux system